MARPHHPLLLTLVAAFAVLLSGCGSDRDGPLDIAVIDSEANLFETGIRLSEGGQLVRGATGAGLVALDAQGQIVPALADRWIVADEGRSYIFRLRDGTWPDGTALTGESARAALQRAIRSLNGTSLGLDLAAVDEVRAMAGRVIEIRLRGPMPDFLRLVAQPELSLTQNGFSAGGMVLTRGDDRTELAFKPPDTRGLPADPGWQEHVRILSLHAATPAEAVESFEDGRVDVVLGGRLGSWPLADPGPLSRGTRRLDAAVGLFGLQVRRERGVLAFAATREALAMAIDRQALLEPFNIGGWVPTTRVVPAAVAGGAASERWADVDVESLRAEAARRIAAMVNGAEDENAARLTLSMSDEPGNAALFNALAQQWAQIGVTLTRVEPGESADLVLIDRVARYADPRWFLNQFNCRLDRGACSAEADEAVRIASITEDADERAVQMARAEAALTSSNVYIPLAMPLRWSLVRGNVDGFAANPWAWHPLPDMATLPR